MIRVESLLFFYDKFLNVLFMSVVITVFSSDNHAKTKKTKTIKRRLTK